MLILAIIVGVVTYMYWRDWVASFGSSGMKQLIAQSQLPPQEIAEIDVQIDRLADGFRTGRLTAEKLAELMQTLSKSPLMTTIAASVIDAQYLSKSGLNDEEKAQGAITLRRFLRGALDQKISEEAVNSAMANVADKQPDGQWKIREKISDEDLRKFLETAKAEADKAEIPAEPEVVDPSDEMKRIVDKALGELPAEAPAENANP